jgi:hypothetical protein
LVLQIMSSFLNSISLVFHHRFSLHKCHLGLASICHFLVFGPSSKGLGSNSWFLTNRIALFNWTLKHYLIQHPSNAALNI